MYHLRKVIPLTLAILLTLAVVPASAQDDEADPLEDIGQLDGIESAVIRSWWIDYDALMAASPEAAGAADPLDIIEGTIFLIGQVIELSGEAEAAFELYRDGVIDELARNQAEDEETFEGPIDNLGDSAHGFDISSTDVDAEDFYRYVMVRDDNYYFLIIVAATSPDATSSGDSLAGYLVDEGETSTAEVSFNEDGTSTGGNWGFFPADDHESLGGLVPSVDEVLYPVPDEDA